MSYKSQFLKENEDISVFGKAARYFTQGELNDVQESYEDVHKRFYEMPKFYTVWYPSGTTELADIVVEYQSIFDFALTVKGATNSREIFMVTTNKNKAMKYAKMFIQMQPDVVQFMKDLK